MKTQTRVIVTGSREFDDIGMVVDALSAVWIGSTGVFVLVHGACPCRHCDTVPCECGNPVSADAIADMWGVKMGAEHVTLQRYPAKWGVYGKRAGFIRNTAMCVPGGDACLAFYKHGAANRGTAHCVQVAQTCGIPVTRFYG